MTHPDMGPTALWLMLLLGAYHGINPGMGWLFAVALGMQEQSRAAVWRALGPLAADLELVDEASFVAMSAQPAPELAAWEAPPELALPSAPEPAPAAVPPPPLHLSSRDCRERCLRAHHEHQRGRRLRPAITDMVSPRS